MIKLTATQMRIKHKRVQIESWIEEATMQLCLLPEAFVDQRRAKEKTIEGYKAMLTRYDSEVVLPTFLKRSA